MKPYIWKIISCILILYSIIAGMLIPVPQMSVIGESIRNLFFHVPMWFAMLSMLIISVIYSIRFLKTESLSDDLRANASVSIGLFLGFTGMATGMLWAKFSWGSIWLNDPKLNGAALGILIYLVYRVLRNAVDNMLLKAKLAAVFNIFAFSLYIIFVFVLPKISGNSIHPGVKESLVFMPTELNHSLKIVFYPALVGWILFATWLLDVLIRIKLLKKN